MSLVDDIGVGLAPALRDRARVYVREGGVRGAGSGTWLVTVPGGRVPFEVKLWPAEEAWSCSCGAEACAHAMAAAIARDEGADPGAAVEVARIRYAFRRHEQSLVLGRAVPADAVRGDADAEFNRRLAGWWDRPGAPKGLLAGALGVLEALPCTLDGAPITCSGRPVYSRALVEDAGQGWRVRLVRAAGIDEAFRDGMLRIGDTLHPIGQVALAPELDLRLRNGLLFDAADAERLVTRFLPELRTILEVEVRSARLPRVIDVVPRMQLDVRWDGQRLRVVPQIVYGDPPVARVQRGALVRIGADLPVRKPDEEARLARQLAADGLSVDVPVEREGAAAAGWVKSLGGARPEILRAAPGLRVEALAADPRVSLIEMGGDFRVDVEAGGVDPKALVAAWEAGESLVPMLGGGWRPLPRDWMARHGTMLAELLAARDPRGVVPRHAAPLLLDAAEALDLPAPPALTSLRALAGDFDAIPAVPVPPDCTATLRTYQQRGVDWLCWLRTVGMGGILADDMGLGKTVQCLVALRIAGGRSLVIAPTSVIRNWASEAARFFPGMRVNVYHGPRRTLDPSADLTVTSYALLRLDLDALCAVRWTTAVLDEAQAIKNPDSQVAAAARALDAEHRIAMTGTPVENRLEELWSAFHFVSPGLLGTRTTFRDRFGNPIANGDRRAQQALRRRIRPFILRRMKSEVAKELPPRTDVVLRCTLSEPERQTYEAVKSLARNDVARLLEGHGMMQVLEVLLRMRQAACHTGLLPGRVAESSAKLDLLAETLEEVLAEGHKALVFSQWTSMLDLVEPRLRAMGVPWTRLDGSTRDRAAVVDAFAAPDGPPVFLLSLKAGGTGLNLTSADYVFHLDPWWNPAVEDQATDRAHRIGQERPVVSCRLIAEDTVEERILELQEHKRGVARAALDEEALARGITRDELLALFD